MRTNEAARGAVTTTSQDWATLASTHLEAAYPGARVITLATIVDGIGGGIVACLVRRGERASLCSVSIYLTHAGEARATVTAVPADRLGLLGYSIAQAEALLREDAQAAAAKGEAARWA